MRGPSTSSPLEDSAFSEKEVERLIKKGITAGLKPALAALRNKKK